MNMPQTQKAADARTDTAMVGPAYTPAGWEHWSDDFWMSYQFRRGLGETQEGAGTIGEVFQAASRIVANDFESWYREWTLHRRAQRFARRRRDGAQPCPQRDELLVAGG